MRTLGLLGGMSWESSIEYERLINEGVVGPEDVPLFPTTRLHAEAAVAFALDGTLPCR